MNSRVLISTLIVLILSLGAIGIWTTANSQHDKPTPRPAPTHKPSPAPTAGRASASNTGVISGTSLTSIPGGTLSQNGATIQNAVITGNVIVSGSNQTWRNVRVTGEVRVTGNGVTIEDSEMGALKVSGGSNFTARRVEIFGALGYSGFHVTSDIGPVSNVLFENSWIHSPQVNAGSHYDGIHVRGVNGIVIRGNYIDLGPWKSQYTASIFLQNANGGNSNVQIDHNWIDGGGYALYLFATNVSITNNLFGTKTGYGLLYPSSDMSSVTSSGNTWLTTGLPVTL